MKRRRITGKRSASPYNPVLTEREMQQLVYSAEAYMEENKELVDWFFGSRGPPAASSGASVISLSESESSD